MNKAVRTIRTIIYIATAAVLIMIAMQYAKLPTGADSVKILVDGSPAGSSVTLAPNEEISLSGRIEPEEFADADIWWESSDESVASVREDGKLTALSEGEAVLKADAEGCSAELAIKVEDTVTSIEGFQTDVTVNVGYTYKVEPVITTKKEGQRAPDPVFKSDDESVVTVSDDGLITAVGSGMANVTVSAGSKSETIIVRVR